MLDSYGGLPYNHGRRPITCQNVIVAPLVHFTNENSCNNPRSFVEPARTHRPPQLWVKDDETFAADPYVALPWGMRGLDLSHIASLASTLKNSLGVGAEQKGTTGATTNETMVPVAELVHKLRTWSDSVATDASGEVTRTEAPAAGFRENRGYVETLCRSIGAGANANEVPWRR